MKNLMLTFLLIVPFFAVARQHTLEGRIKGLEAKKVFISDFFGNEKRAFDSTAVDKNGSFKFTFPPGRSVGLYRLRFGENRFVDIIYNGEDISFETYANALIDSLKFTKSVENKLYFEYLNRRNETEYRLSLLDPLLSRYPSNDPFYKQIVAEFTNLNTGLESYLNKLIAENQNTFTVKIVKAERMPMPDVSLVEDARTDYMKAHFFDQADFSDTLLLRTNLISNKVMQYLSFYQNNRMTKDQLEIEFIKAMQVIMNKTKSSPAVYAYAMEYLISGFESYGFEKVITYIADNINLEETCVDDERKAKLENKVESLKKFAIGLKAPDFTATDLKGNTVKLSAVKSEYTLLVFWATWCPHCTRLIPELKKIYLPNNKEKLEIVAVSLDESKTELDTFLKDGGFDWINISDFKKWKGDIVQQYDIYATPTMLLLSKDGTITAKPMTFDDVKNELYKRNVLK
jgi:peroxiredoxin